MIDVLVIIRYVTPFAEERQKYPKHVLHILVKALSLSGASSMFQCIQMGLDIGESKPFKQFRESIDHAISVVWGKQMPSLGKRTYK